MEVEFLSSNDQIVNVAIMHSDQLQWVRSGVYAFPKAHIRDYL